MNGVMSPGDGQSEAKQSNLLIKLFDKGSKLTVAFKQALIGLNPFAVDIKEELKNVREIVNKKGCKQGQDWSCGSFGRTFHNWWILPIIIGTPTQRGEAITH